MELKGFVEDPVSTVSCRFLSCVVWCNQWSLSIDGSAVILAHEEASLLCLKMVTTWTEVREANEADELGTQVADQHSE